MILLALVSCFVGCCGSDKKDFYTKLIDNSGAEKDKINAVYPIYLMRGKYNGKEFIFDSNNLKVPIEDIKITDANVLSFANDMVDLLRKKSLAKRSIQLTHDSLDFLAIAKLVHEVRGHHVLKEYPDESGNGTRTTHLSGELPGPIKLEQKNKGIFCPDESDITIGKQ